MENIKRVQIHTENHSFQVCRFLLYCYSIFSCFTSGFRLTSFVLMFLLTFFVFVTLFEVCNEELLSMATISKNDR